MSKLVIGERREQAPMLAAPYDQWRQPDGGSSAQFFRLADSILIRFPKQVDFEIAPEAGHVHAHPVPGIDDETVTTLFINSVQPMLRNHAGELNLHGSAVGTGAACIAFLGVSRSGKTTLAGAMAKKGHPFLTEDVIELDRKDAAYLVQPFRPILRLFDDSASYLLDRQSGSQNAKKAVDASDALPHAKAPLPLKAIFLLGPGKVADVSAAPLSEAQALMQLMQHSFILDCEDEVRLQGHFLRLAQLAQSVRCYALDYPRDYKILPDVRRAILKTIDQA